MEIMRTRGYQFQREHWLPSGALLLAIAYLLPGWTGGLGIAAITTTAGDPDDRASGLKQPSEFRKPGYADVHCPVCGERSENDL